MQRCNHMFRLHTFQHRNRLAPEHSSHHDRIRKRQRINKFPLKHIPPQCIRSRLQNRPNPSSFVSRAQRSQRLANRRRMMRKIINHRNSSNLSANLQTPLYALERRQTLDNRLNRNSLSRSQSSSSSSIQRIVFAGHRKRKPSKVNTAAQQSPTRARAFLPHLNSVPIRIGIKSISFHPAKRLRRTLRNVRTAIKSHQSTSSRNQVHHPLERCLHSLQVRIDIGMVKLHVGQNCRVRKVVQKLRPFIEEGRVVFVALQNERSSRVHHAKAVPKILRNSANQERRLPARISSASDLIDPRQHRSRRCLAMRSANHQRLATMQKFLMNKRGHRRHRNPLIQHVFQLHVTARNGIPDNNQIRRRLQVSFGIRLQDRNVHRPQLIAHRWISRCVRACYAMSLRPKHSCQRGHRCPADPDQMHMFHAFNSSTNSNDGRTSQIKSTCAPRTIDRLPEFRCPHCNPIAIGPSKSRSA